MRRLVDGLLIVVFLCGLSLPLADLRFELDASPPLIEKRTPAPAPSLPRDWSAVREFPPQFEKYWNDGFGFRRALVRNYNRLLIASGTSPLPDVVTVGTDKWIFYAAEQALEGYKGLRPFPEPEMIRWQYLLEARRDWLHDRGIPYLFVIAPNKETIYPEHMPRRVERGAVHRLDQFLAHLAAHSDFEVIDERERLFAGKADHQLYRKTDSHWSDRGAFLVDEAIADRLQMSFPAVQPLSADALRVAMGAGAGDLVNMLGLTGLITEPWEFVAPLRPKAHPASPPTNVSSWTETDVPGLPRGVFFHDSFGRIQIPFLGEHFSHVRNVWVKELDPAIVEAEGAQVVVHEMCERFLLVALPEDSMLLSDNSRVRGDFESSTKVLVRFPGRADAITPLSRLTADRSDPAGATLTADGERGSALLPPIEVPAGFVPVVRVQIDSPADGRLEMWYPTDGQANYDQLRSHWWPLHAGANVAWFVLPDPQLRGRLRLDLTAPGAYRLRSLEVRAVAARRGRASAREGSPTARRPGS